MSIQKIALLGWLFLLAQVLSIAVIAVLALPFSWLWNWAVVPALGLPAIDYVRSFGLLLVWVVLSVAARGVQLSAKVREDY